MTVPYEDLLNFIKARKEEIQMAGSTNKDEYILKFETFLRNSDAVARDDLKQAALITLDGVKHLQTTALGFIALSGSLIQFFFARGLDWDDATIRALALAASLAAVSLWCGFKAIGATVDQVETAAAAQVGIAWPRASRSWWKHSQSIVGLLALVAFAAAIATYPTGTPEDSALPSANVDISINDWNKLELNVGSLKLMIGPTDQHAGAYLRVDAR